MSNFVIEGQVQSPLCTALNGVKPVAGSLTSTVDNNVPPLEIFAHDVVKTLSGQQGRTLDFAIEPLGRLRRVSVTLELNANTVATHITDNAVKWNPTPAYDIIDRVELRTRNSKIETHYGLTMLDEAQRRNSEERDRLLSLAGGVYVDGFSETAGAAGGWDLTDSRQAGSTYQHYSGSSVDCTIQVTAEIPLLVNEDMGHALDTRLMEPLFLRVFLRDGTLARNRVSAPVDLEKPTYREARVRCHYVRFHDTTEVDIRGANFGERGYSTMLGQDNILVGSKDVQTDVSEYRFDVDSRQFVQGFTIMCHGSRANGECEADDSCAITTTTPIKRVRVLARGQTLYDSSHFDVRIGDRFLTHLLGVPEDNYKNSSALSGFGAGANYFGLHVNLALSASQLYKSGGVALQTLDPFQVIVDLYDDYKLDQELELVSIMGVSVWARVQTVNQIDGGSGVIMRVFDQ